MRGDPFLLAGGGASIAAALVHLATIAGGPDWYRFFGAGEPIARAAERGSPVPALLTCGIATGLFAFAAWALSAGGWIRALPLRRTGLAFVTAIYLARGAFILNPAAMPRPDLTMTFLVWSSLIVLAMGLVHAIGLLRVWRHI